MKRKVIVSAGYQGVLPVGPYSNLRPSFGASCEYEMDFETDEILKLNIETMQQELQTICFQSFEREAEKARILKVQQDVKNFRFYPVDVNGETVNFPSVTSIAGYDKEFFNLTDDDLKIYCAQGTIYDAEIRNFVKTGTWKESKDLLECTADRHILKTRATSTGKTLSLESCKFREFLEKFPVTDLKSCEEPAFNRKYKYAGTPDLIGTYNGLKTIVSIKRTKSETDNLVQESAYAKCDGMNIEQMMVVEMKVEADGGNKSGFSKPIVSTEIDRYFELFLRKRSEVQKIYGV